MVDPIGDDDLHAYVDNQLTEERRIEVADYLAYHPDAAARVFADIRSRAALKLACGSISPLNTPRILTAAGRLQRSFLLKDAGRWATRAAAAIALICVGWYAHWQAGAFTIVENDDTPAFVVDAVHAYRTHLLRAQAKMNDAEDIFLKTQIAMPNLKQDWKLSDVQMYPSHFGSSVEATLLAGELGQLSLFATRTEQTHSIEPTISRSPSETTVYWRRGSIFYALTGKRPDKIMRSIADILMKG